MPVFWFNLAVGVEGNPVAKRGHIDQSRTTVGVGQGVFPFGIEDQQPDIGRGGIKLRHQVLDEIALAVARPRKDETAPAFEAAPR